MIENTALRYFTDLKYSDINNIIAAHSETSLLKVSVVSLRVIT